MIIKRVYCFKYCSFTCAEMLKVCSLGGIKFDCCRMSKRVLTDLGWCFAFSVGNITIKQRLPGIFNGYALKFAVL